MNGVHLAVSLFVIVTILLQSGKSAGLSGTIAGGQNIFGKNKGRTLDSLFSKLTSVAAIGFLLHQLCCI